MEIHGLRGQQTQELTNHTDRHCRELSRSTEEEATVRFQSACAHRLESFYTPQRWRKKGKTCERVMAQVAWSSFLMD